MNTGPAWITVRLDSGRTILAERTPQGTRIVYVERCRPDELAIIASALNHIGIGAST